MALTHVPVAPLPPQRFRELLGDRYGELEEAIAQARERFAGRAVWHVNSTARGGGVAELLQSLLAYARGGGVDTRWVVVEGDADFFQVTKRIHNNLHGAAGDGGAWARRSTRCTTRRSARLRSELADTVDPDDIVLLHDPQTAGLVAAARETRATIVWRCHVGLDLPNDLAREAGTSCEATSRRPRHTSSRARSSCGRGSTREGLDRPAVDRRVLPQEPGARRRTR